MNNPEIRSQTVNTAAQWKCGVHTRMDVSAAGVSLFHAPTFDRFVARVGAGDIAVSKQGEAFWSEQENGRWTLYRLHPDACRPEALLSLSAHGITGPDRLWWTPRHLWILDRPTKRVLAFSLREFQVTREVNIAGALVDVAIDAVSETVYSLEKWQGKYYVRVFPSPPERAFTVHSELFARPTLVAAGPQRSVVIVDAQHERFLYLRNGVIQFLGEMQLALDNFQPIAMEIDRRGAIYLAAARDPVRMFDPDGSFLLEVKLPSVVKSIQGLGFDSEGALYLASNAGIAIFFPTQVPVGVPGTVYLPVLDNGKPEGYWHGVTLWAKLPAKSGLEVAYYASDNADLERLYTNALGSGESAAGRAAKAELLLGPLWVTDTGAFAGSGSADERRFDMLFTANRGRYLWLRLRLTAYDGASQPLVRKLKVLYPRVSLLRYLPSVFREDPVSAAFLERFLALFETVFQDLDEDITGLFKHFDPALTPPQFLSWLGSWLSLALDDDLPEASKRKLIAEAPSLFRAKGTPDGIRRFLEIYTGATVEVREPMLETAPLIAGELRLGRGTILERRTPGALSLGSEIALGLASLVAKDKQISGPLASAANRFEISLAMDAARFAKRQSAIRRAISSVVPANAHWTVRRLPDQPKIGTLRVTPDLLLTGPQPFCIGVTHAGDLHTLGDTIGISAPHLERGAAITPDWRLIE